MESLGLDEIFDKDALVLIEWGEKFPRLMPADRIEIRLESMPDDTRRITITRSGQAGKPVPL